MTFIERARSLFRPRSEGTPGQIDQERETAVSLGLMAKAKAAGAEMTDEQAIFLSSSIAGMNARIAYLRGPDVPKPLSLAQERELTMIERELARLEGRDEAKPVLVAREGGWTPPRLAALAGNLGLYGIVAAGVGVVAILGWWRLDVAVLKGQRDRGCTRAELQGETTRRPCVDLTNANRDLTVRTRERDNAREAIATAQAAARASRQEAEAADRRASAAAARARRRTDALRQIDAGGPPPAWERSLRDDEPVQQGATPSSGGDAAGGDRR